MKKAVLPRVIVAASLLGGALQGRAQTDLGTFDFGNVPVGTTKTVSGFAWSGGSWNGQDLVMVSEQFIGPDAADFGVSTNYTGVTMPYGHSFPFSMSFTPSHAGAETSTLSLYETPAPPFGASIWHITGMGRTPITVTGPIVPELAPLAQAMTNYMSTHGFESGTLALMKDTKLVLRQGFGWRDRNLTIPAHPDNLFRLASVSKTITESAITKLVNAGKLTMGTKVYAYLGIQPWGGVLGDSRITNITVQNLVDHSGGWNRDVSPVGDPVFNTIQISMQMGLNYPAAPTNVISWMFSKPLDFAPGATNAYSNFGYQILGRVIEKASGKRYIDYLQQDLLGAASNTNLIGFTNIIQSRSRPRDLDPWETWYADSPTTSRSAVDYPTNLFVRWVDGAGYWESFDAFGGISASAIGLCNYLRNYWMAGDQRYPGEYYGWDYIFYGSLPGVTSVIYQSITQNPTSTNGLEFAALFNARTGGDDNGEAEAAIYNASTNITSWPANGGGMIQWSVPQVNVDKSAGNVTVQLVRSGLSTLPVKVSYMTYAKNAGLANYVPSSGVLSFAAGETSKDVSVTILNDSGSGAPKQLLLELVSASGGAWLGDRFTCIVNILEQNSPARFISESMLTNGNFRAQISGATGLVLRVEVSTNLVNWTPLQTFTNSIGLLNVPDPSAGTRLRSFYRTVVQ